MRSNYLFTSESVSEGHPDKVSDQISDSIVDLFLSKDPEARIACETLTTTQLVVLAGEIRCKGVYEDGAWAPGTWIGLGILGYGIIYSLIHDGLVHQRYFRWVPRRGYARRLVQAHRLHHATIGKEGGVSFGFVFARDPAALKRELKAQRTAGIAVLREALED